MKHSSRDTVRRAGLSESGVELGGEIRETGRFATLRRRLLDAAVALTEGADPEHAVRDLEAASPRVAAAVRRDVDLSVADPARALASYLLSITFGMRLATV